MFGPELWFGKNLYLERVRVGYRICFHSVNEFNLNWFGHTQQEAEMKFEFKWQEYREFTLRNWEVFFHPAPQNFLFYLFYFHLKNIYIFFILFSILLTFYLLKKWPSYTKVLYPFSILSTCFLFIYYFKKKLAMCTNGDLSNECAFVGFDCFCCPHL